MKRNIKLNKILSNILAFIMLSSTMYIPQNLVLAQQLSQIKIVDDNTEDENEDTSKEEGANEDTSKEEGVSEDISKEEGANEDISKEEDVNEDISKEEGANEDTSKEEGANEDISKEEGVNEDTSKEENETILNTQKPINDEVQAYSSILDDIIIQDDGTITGYNGSSATIGELTIPRQIKGIIVKEIGKKAFVNKGITKLTFTQDSEVETIGNNAFENNPIESIELSPSILNIKDYAFQNCKYLQSIDTVNVTTIGQYAFSGCIGLQTANMLKVTDIGRTYYGSSFYSCTSLSSVVMPEVTFIGQDTFNKCTSLLSVTMPKVTNIDFRVFGGCTNLTSLEILEVTRIGGSAFESCTNLQAINMPKLTTMDSRAFENCTSLIDIKVPKLTTIQGYAFDNCKNLTTIDLPEVITIPSGLFNNCSKLKNINIPKATTIKEYAFYYCSSIVNIDMPEVTSIEGYSIFSNCKALTSLNIPKLQKISSNAFSNGDSLTEIRINAKKEEVTGSEYAPWGANNAIVYWADTAKEGDFIVDGGYHIQRYTGNGGNVVIPDKITSIGTNAFFNNTALTSIQMPKVTKVDAVAFKGCTNLKTVYMPEVITINAAAFEGCTNLIDIDMSSVKEIGQAAFSECTSLVYVQMPEVINLGNEDYYSDGVFQGCTSLTNVYMPKVEVLGYYAFLNCPSLKEITLPQTVRQFCVLHGINLFSKETIVKIPHYTLEEIKNNITSDNGYPIDGFPFGAKAILYKGTYVDTTGEFVFMENGSLVGYLGNSEDITIPEKLSSDDLSKDIDITTIASSAFRNNGIIKTVDMPYITDLEESAFRGCSNLTSVNIPKVTNLKKYVFNFSQKLNSVNMPNVTTIETGAFGSCKALLNIDLSQVTSIGFGAFEQSGLVNVYMPKVTVLESSVFRECRNLESVVAPELLDIKPHAFLWDSKLTTIEMPKLKTISGNQVFERANLKYIDLPELESVGSSAFDYCKNLISVNLPKAKTVTGFKDCVNLQSINMPNVETIGYGAFNGCTSLTGVDIQNVVTIGEKAFSGCTSLTGVDISNVVTIDREAFSGCTSLTEITIPKTTTKIGSNAFSGTTNLKSIYIEQLSSGGVIPSGQDSMVPVYYLGQYVKMDYDILREQPTNITVKQKGKIDPNTFYIKVDYNGYGEVLTKIEATGKPDETNSANSLIDEESRAYEYKGLDLENLEKETYIFKASGAFNNSNNSNLSKTFTKNVNITGFVNYLDNSGAHLSDIDVDTKRYNPGETVKITSQIPKGQGRFLGWTTQKNGTSVEYSINNQDTLPMSNTNISLYPVFDTKAINATLTLDYNYDGSEIDKVIDTVFVNDVYDLTNENPKERVGYVFTGWYKEKDAITKVNNSFKITSQNTTLYAGWQAKQYTITYNADGGQIDSNTQQVTYDQDYTLKIPTKSGYKFNGWYKDGVLFENTGKW